MPPEAPPMAFLQRPARREDMSALLPLMVDLCAGNRALAADALESAIGAGPPGHEAWVMTEVTDTTGSAAPPVLRAIWESAIPVGFLALSPSSAPHFRVGFVEWIAVDPAARRRGIGRRLLALAQHRATVLAWRQLHACTFHTNRPALHMYIDAGFCPTATLPDYGGPGLHYVELVWPVGAAKGPRDGEGDEEIADSR